MRQKTNLTVVQCTYQWFEIRCTACYFMQTHGGMFGGEREMKQALTELNLDVTHGDLFGLEGGGQGSGRRRVKGLSANCFCQLWAHGDSSHKLGGGWKLTSQHLQGLFSAEGRGLFIVWYTFVLQLTTCFADCAARWSCKKMAEQPGRVGTESNIFRRWDHLRIVKGKYNSRDDTY